MADITSGIVEVAMNWDGVRQWEITCSKCNSKRKVDSTKNGALSVLREWGWRIGKNNLCPTCQGKEDGGLKFDRLMKP